MKIIFQDNEGKVIREEIFSEADVIAMDTDMVGKREWICNAFRNKIRQCKDKIVEQSGRGSRMTDIPTKDQIILDLKTEKSLLVESAADRMIRENIKKD